MTRLSEKEGRALCKKLGVPFPEPPKQKKRHKYNARKVTLDGITFASQKEADYYCQLLLRQKAGEIEKFELQPVFVLQEGYWLNGKKIREIKYIADFKVFYPDGRIEIVDTKGYRTRTYLNKKKMLLKRYPGIWFTEVA